MFAYNISMIYAPLSEMQVWALTLTFCSPLKYIVNLFNAVMIGNISIFPVC